MKDSSENAKGAVSFGEDGRAMIHLYKGHDFSTLTYTSALIYRRSLNASDMKIAEDELGVKDGKWEAEHEEKFARGFERYTADGEPPTEALREAFNFSKASLSRIYNPIEGSPIDVYVSSEMRKLYGRILGG